MILFNMIVSGIVLACSPNYNGTGSDPMLLQCYHPMQTLQAYCIDYEKNTQEVCQFEQGEEE